MKVHAAGPGVWPPGGAVPTAGKVGRPVSPGPADCSVKPCTKQLHLTLAHKFYPHHQRTLEQLARALHPGHGCQWAAALYSRDMRFVHYQVGGCVLPGPMGGCPSPHRVRTLQPSTGGVLVEGRA